MPQPHVEAENTVRISVRNLVEFVLRSGDIDTRVSSAAGREAMLEGARIHRRIQKSMGSGYQAEVPLRETYEYPDFTLVLEGRADGIEQGPDGVVIDEIKTVLADPDRLEGPVPVHLAQAVCYGAIYSAQNHLERLTIQMTYCSQDDGKIRRFRRLYTAGQLQEELRGLLEKYRPWAEFAVRHRKRRDASLDGLQFPFPYRPGQRKLVVSAWKAMKKGETLLIQAPTGVGKTMSVMFPAALMLLHSDAERIFYLTARTTTRETAEESVRILRDRGACLTSVTITAKDRLCFLEKRDCNPDACPYAKGHFDRVGKAAYDLVCEEGQITEQVILERAEREKVCPFEFCLDLTEWTDCIICDYNYVFDPNVRLQRFFGDGSKGEHIFLIDEAHNLAERGREMYSAAVVKESFLKAKKIYSGYPDIVKLADAVNRRMLALKKDCGDAYKVYPDSSALEPLTEAVRRLFEALSGLPDRDPSWKPTDEASDFFFSLRDYLAAWDRLSESYRIYTENRGDGTFQARLFCVNPSEQITKCVRQGIAAVFFSATLLPIAYYRDLLTGSQDTPAIYIPSPFDRRRRLIAAASDVTTRYTRRSAAEYARCGQYITAMLQARKGNYLVFFPSYRMLQNVVSVTAVPEGYRVLRQSQEMDGASREEFLRCFSDRDRPTVGFCVTGGIFAEGIDLRGESLIGVCVVGTGLAQICTENEILRSCYEDRGLNGFSYAYLYPGMNRVMQAAGRLIRTDSDLGVILLMDERFLRSDYRALFPPEWSDCGRVTLSTVKNTLSEFWERFPDSAGHPEGRAASPGTSANTGSGCESPEGRTVSTDSGGTDSAADTEISGNPENPGKPGTGNACESPMS